MNKPLLPLLLAAAPLLIACGAPTHAAQLNGTRWTFVEIDGQAPVSTATSMTFAPDRLGVNVGCNGMGGDWKDGGETIEVGPMISTMMYCDGIAAQETAVGQLLHGRVGISRKGDRLWLVGNGHTAILRKVR